MTVSNARAPSQDFERFAVAEAETAEPFISCEQAQTKSDVGIDAFCRRQGKGLYTCRSIRERPTRSVALGVSSVRR